ncbi:MAG: VCBS repeat-containing protein, partial [Planctomycetia bacterium]|nr:VCBS repeat-containing protein [Planctomycetia bacterium]
TITFTATDGSTQVVTVTITGDEDLPQVLLAADMFVVNSTLMRGETTEVYVTFSEPVLDFDTADISAPNGQLSPLVSVDGGFTWVASFTPTDGIAVTESRISVDLAGVVIESTGTAGSGTISTVIAIDTTARRPVDLSITITDSQDRYVPGGKVTFVATVSNAGTQAVEGAVVRIPVPVGVVSATWVAVGDGNIIGSGSGPLDRTLTIGAGGSVTIMYVAVVSPTATAGIAALATVSAPAGLIDSDPTNNAALDIDVLDVPSLIVASSDLGVGGPTVQLIDPVSGEQRRFTPFEASFIGGVSVACADLTGDGIDELIVGPGRGRVAEIRVFTQWGVELPAYRTIAFPGYTGGVIVAAGDVTGDGQADIIASMMSGRSEVRVYQVSPAAADPVVNAPWVAFQPFGNSFAGGVSVAAADVGRFDNGVLRDASTADGRHEIVVGSGSGMAATVKVYDLSTRKPRLVDTILPFKGVQKVGMLSLSVGRLNGDTIDDIVIASGPGNGGVVAAYSGRVDDKQDLRLVNAAPFTTRAHRNAAVTATALDLDGDGIADRIFASQGDGGDVGAIRQIDGSGKPVAASAAVSRVGPTAVRLTSANSGAAAREARRRMNAVAAVGGVGRQDVLEAAFASIAEQAKRTRAGA